MMAKCVSNKCVSVISKPKLKVCENDRSKLRLSVVISESHSDESVRVVSV